MRNLCTFLVVCVLWSVSAHQAAAVLQFYKVWETEYLTDHQDPEFAALVKKPANRCYVCHVGKKRSHRNIYGAQMDELLDRKADIKDKKKILAAIKQVGAMHSDPNDGTSPTFDALIAAGKFPGGELEEMKKEPAE